MLTVPDSIGLAHPGIRAPMGPQQLRDCMSLLGWTGATLAAQLGCGRSLVMRWMNGTSLTGMPPSVAHWIIQRANAVIAFPPPPLSLWQARTVRNTYKPTSATRH